MPKIASWNVNSLKVRSPQVAQYLKDAQPDILGLQELKQTDDAVDSAPFTAQGYHTITHGQKTYNGVALLSKAAPENIVRGIPNYEDSQARAIAASYGDLRVLNLYVPNGKEIDDEKYVYKLEWFTKLQAYIADSLKTYPKLIIIGDFNIAPEDIDTYDATKWHDKILCSAPERNALQAILALGLRDAFREKYPDVQQFSWWDYRMGGFRRNNGLRIDLTLISEPLTLIDAGIDSEPRKWERPSDHTPAWVKIS